MEQLKIVVQGHAYWTPLINCNATFLEIAEPEHIGLRNGQHISCVRSGQAEPMKVVKHNRRSVILLPLQCDLNHLCGEEPWSFEAYNNEEPIYASYRLNTFGVVSGKGFSQPVRVVTLSKLGIGFTIHKFCLNFDDTYQLTVACYDESVTLSVSLSHAHMQEKGIYYSAAIRSIGDRDLDMLQYYTAVQQLK